MGLRTFLDKNKFIALTTTFEALHGINHLPEPACRCFMVDRDDLGLREHDKLRPWYTP